jgi:predicted nucleic acid-binding protein
MTPVFIDSSYLLALVLTDDQDHQAALNWRPSPGRRSLTTEYVLLEVLDGLSAAKVRDIGLRTVELLRANSTVEIIPASTSLLEEGMQLFGSRRDKDWGITDCISFIVMGRHGIREALTADHHFEQAGFVALLLKSPPAP